MAEWSQVIKDLGTKNRLSDCCFIIEAANGRKKCFKCHKFIFSSVSKVFERMLYGNFLESKSNEIVLKNVKIYIFEIFFEYLYNYDMSVLVRYDDKRIMDLAKFAHQYEVTSVKEDCVAILLQRTWASQINQLIPMYQLGNEILHEDFIKVVSERMTSRFRRNLNNNTIYNLSPDVFFKYVEMCKDKMRENKRFKMIKAYLKVNKFDMSKDISIPSDDLDADDANKEDKDLEQHDQGEIELEDNNELEVKSNVSNEDKKETIQNIKFTNVKNSYIKSLLKLIDYMKMTREEFFYGPGRTEYFDTQEKYHMLYAIMIQK